jgi:hypothetical protein
MTCPAKLKSGKVDQSGSMLSDDVEEKGFTLLCMAVPETDVELVTCTEVRGQGGGSWVQGRRIEGGCRGLHGIFRSHYHPTCLGLFSLPPTGGAA